MAIVARVEHCCIAAPRHANTVPAALTVRACTIRNVAARANATEDKLKEGVRALEQFEKLTTREEKIPLRSIDNLDSNYCDDFECTSSPAVESTVRAFARDIIRQRYTALLFNKDVAFSDGFRSFKGIDKYSRKNWYQVSLVKPQVSVAKMRMVDKSTAEVRWRIAGAMAGQQVDIGVTSTITLNLLTGRIATHTESWDLSQLSPTTAAMATFNRWAWSLTQAADDARSGVSRTLSDGLSSIDGSQDQGTISNNPTDPTKFFFHNQQESQFNDYVSYATVAALLYFLYRAFTEVNQL